MSVLRNLESKLTDLVEGTFGRVFRSEVRPIEISRKLVKEMDEHRTVSVSRTYVPNEYTVWLSPEDRARYEGAEQEIIGELAGYLLEHARKERLTLVSRPRIEFQTDDRLSLGEFGIQARLVRPEQDDAGIERPPAQAEQGHTMIYSTAQRVREPVEATSGRRPQRATLLAEGKRFAVAPTGATIGRSRECDIVLGDANVSRRHAEVRPVRTSEATWTIQDLGSTNGVRVNGRVADGAQPLGHGDRIELGTADLIFELE
ncbi:MAG TPA: DUF3662 and FHA domain-containing protein [Solirubrobacteraceae bacterium]|nr:DUF3662 and FHA domain-containing protein [Solirubrobacteraceae bacterium]